MPSRTRLDLSALAAAGWLAAVAAIVAARAATGDPGPSDLASSADALLRGELWRLPASALIVEGRLPAVQVAGTAVLTWAVVHHLGGRLFWAVAITAHVGATLAADAGLGVLWSVDPHAADRIAAAQDYGISAVAAGCVGALAAAGLLGAVPRPRIAVALGVVALLACAVLLPARGELADVEHLLALLAGAMVATVALHHGDDAHRDPLRSTRLPSLRRRPHRAPSALG